MIDLVVSSSNGGLLQHWYELAGIIVSIPVALGLTWGMFKGIGHLQRVHEAIIGRPGTAYSEAIPSIIERFHDMNDHLEAQDDRLDLIESEFHTNSGTTIKDDLVMVKDKLSTIEKAQQLAAVTKIEVAAELADTVEMHSHWPPSAAVG